MELSEVVILPDGLQGIELTAKIEKVYEVKKISLKTGKDFNIQNLLISDRKDENIKCVIGIGREFVTSSVEGSLAVFLKCKKGSYVKDGETRVNIKCMGEHSLLVEEAKTETREPVRSATEPAGKMSKGDWIKTNLQIARQSSLERATDLITCLINNKIFPEGVDVYEFAKLRAEEFVRFVYNGHLEKEEDKISGNDGQGDEVIKREKINLIKKAQIKYKIPDESLAKMLFAAFKVMDMAELSYFQLNDFLAHIVDIGIAKTKADEILGKNEASIEADGNLEIERGDE